MKLFELGDSGSRRTAIDGFVGFGTAASNAIPLLMKASVEENYFMREDAVYALGRIHADGEHVIPFLIARLQEDPDSTVRRNAAFAIGAFGTQASNAIASVMKAKEDPDAAVRVAVEHALRKIAESEK